MDLEPSFGRWVHARRRALDLTQDELARQVGCSLVMIQKVESDARRPSRQIAERIADCLKIDGEQRAAVISLARGEQYVDPQGRDIADDPSDRLPRAPNKLPIPLTPLIGRKQELATLGSALLNGDVRLLTLIGAPGIGKTRLALEIARRVQAAFTHGTAFIALASITDPAQVITTIAQTLEIRDATGTATFDRLIRVLQQKRMLLVLDNAEHLLDAAPQIVALLEACPGLKALVTSRAVLHVRGEYVFVVPPLPLPALSQRLSVSKLARNPAVALFLRQAQAVQPAFQFTMHNASLVAAVCVQLEGLPLAIELAAAHVNVLSLQLLLSRLERRLLLLTDGPRDMPARQRTLAGAIAWSYDLLDATEQLLFARFGVFVGGATTRAAEVILSDEDVPAPNTTIAVASSAVLPGIAALISKSLLRHEEQHDGTLRLTMLETIREYALERLAMSGDLERLRRRHATYFLAYGEEQFTRSGSELYGWMEIFQHEYDNMLAALAWSQTSASDGDMAVRLANAVSRLWWQRGIRDSAILAIERSLCHQNGVPRTRAQALARIELANLYSMTGEYRRAQHHYEFALAIARELGERGHQAKCLDRLGWLARERGDIATAQSHLHNSLTLFRELGVVDGVVSVLNTMAGIAILREDPVSAEALLLESRKAARLGGLHNANVGWTLNHLGQVAQLRGDYTRAVELHQESLSYFASGYHAGLIEAYLGLGESMFGLGQSAEGARYVAQALELSNDTSHHVGVAWCLAGLGYAAALSGQDERAAQLWGAADHARQTLGCRQAPATRAAHEEAMAKVQASLGPEAFAAAWAAGHSVSSATAADDFMHLVAK